MMSACLPAFPEPVHAISHLSPGLDPSAMQSKHLSIYLSTCFSLSLSIYIYIYICILCKVDGMARGIATCESNLDGPPGLRNPLEEVESCTSFPH